MVTTASAGERSPARWQRLLPGLVVLRHYERAWLRGDVVGGVTVAAYLVPQVMAYATLAGLDPVVGLWATIGPLLVYLLLGSSRELSVGPESTTALMTAAAIAGLSGGLAPERVADIAAALAICVGLVALLGWVARLGFLADLLSKPVLIGFMTGIAVLMVTSQLGAISGISIEADNPYGEVVAFLTGLGGVHLPTLLLGVAGLVLLFVLRAVAPKVPGTLVFVALAALASWLFDLGGRGVALVGEVPRGLSVPGLPDVTGLDLAPLLVAAVGVALVAYSDMVLVGRSFAAGRGEQIDPRQEFLALGATNLAAGLSAGMPVSCSGSRVAVGHAAGTRTQLHALVAAAAIIAVMFVGGPVLALFPKAALAAVVVHAGIRLVDVADWRRLARFRHSELVLAVLTALGVMFLGVLVGIGIAVGLSVLDLLRRLARPHDGILGRAPGVAGMHDIDDYPDAVQVPGLVVYRYDAPLFFANADNFIHRALDAVDTATSPARWLLINAEANVEVDLTAVDALVTLHEELDKRGVVLALARVKQDLRDQLARAGIIDLVGEQFIFATLPTAEEAYEQWALEHPAGPTG
ncbi:sulfate permease [Aestuariimicrobium sp. Y1814]|uniref:sulfate permease n=1 Tax=Aestuariimicrobium sp. Y1814 TaxID=3418742 RepID=UPI003DA73C23